MQARTLKRIALKKRIVLGSLGVAISALASGLQAAPASPAGIAVGGPVFSAEAIGPLCPAAHDASRYTTNYQQNFITLVQAQDDWLFRTREDLRTDFGTTAAGYRMLKRLRDALKSKGVELVVVYQPTRGLVNRSKLNPQEYARFNYAKALQSYRATLQKFQQLGLWVPDLAQLTDEQHEQPFYFRGDQHWSPYGAQRTARLVAAEVKRIPAFAEVPRREFVTRKEGIMGKSGTLHNVAGQLCGTSYATQYTDHFITEPKDESSGDALFGEASTPQITLVGTSHSGKNYNFEGFLQQYIGAEVMNVAAPGGGLEGAMIEYLGSDEFQQNPPKVLIWEFSPLYSLDQDKVYRQMMALLDNGCEGKPAVLANKTRLRPGRNEVLVNGEQQFLALRSDGYQLDIRLSDPSVKVLEATLWYMNGRREKLKLEKTDTMETNGRFAFELRDEQDWAEQNLLALDIQGPATSGQALTVDAKLCKRNSFPSSGKLTATSGG
jgi:alginate biosynthesis protein AlgX